MIKTRLKFVPVTIIKGYSGPCCGESLGAWQWFVRNLVEQDKAKNCWDRVPYEFINCTSSINNGAPNKIGGEEYYRESDRRMVDLLLRAGDKGGRGKFLKQIGIASWSDLENPVIATIQTSTEFPNRDWFKMAGRTFKKSPNSCHAGATSVHRVELELKWDATAWAVSVEYGYPHDSSSWHWNIWQKDGERLDAFSARVDAEIEESLTPDLEPHREYREREWWKTRMALEKVFYDPLTMSEWKDQLADAMSNIEGGSLAAFRIPLTPRRLATLKKWVK